MRIKIGKKEEAKKRKMGGEIFPWLLCCLSSDQEKGERKESSHTFSSESVQIKFLKVPVMQYFNTNIITANIMELAHLIYSHSN